MIGRRGPCQHIAGWCSCNRGTPKLISSRQFKRSRRTEPSLGAHECERRLEQCVQSRYWIMAALARLGYASKALI
jgi:hypothetical protein